jgi:hypothetical protein
MEKRAIVLALALTLPLALYGIPYAYATITSSAYVISRTIQVPPSGSGPENVKCNTGDYATGVGGYDHLGNKLTVQSLEPIDASGTNIFSGTPAGFQFGIGSTETVATDEMNIYVICQTPLTVAGVTVPEFGSLYIAIALGAIVYFALSRQYAGKRASQATITT